MSDSIVYVDELYHHGVLGQKWGIRRYQNRDGTLTALGKQKYGNDISKRKVSDVRKQSKKAIRSGVIDLSNSEPTKKMWAEVDKTPEGKKMKNANKVLEEIYKSAEKNGIPRDKIVLDKDTADLFNQISYDYEKKAKEFYYSHADEYASITLTSLGYNDTKAGREWLKQQNFLDW